MKNHEQTSGNEEIYLDKVELDNGNTLEVYCDRRNDEINRYYIKNPNGEVVEFGDPRQFNQVKDEYILLLKHQLAEDGILVTDEEAKRIAIAIQNREFIEQGFDAERDIDH